MHRSIKKFMLMAALALSLAGCQHLPRVGLTVQPSASEVKLIEINKEHEKKQEELKKKIEELSKSFQTKFDSNLSLASANVYAALDTLEADPFKTKYTLAAIPALEVAKAAIPQPTVKDLQEANSSQRKMLSEQATEIAKGKAELEVKKQEALASKEAQEKILAEKSAIEKAKSEEAVAHTKTVIELKDSAIKEKNELAAAKQKEIDDAKAADKKELQSLIVKILMGFGILAAIIAFVIKGPAQLFNPFAAVLSAASIGLALAIAMLPTWAWVAGIGLLFAGIIFTILYEVKRYRDIAKVSVGAIQERKNVDPEGHKDLAAHLKDWTGGNVKLEQNIDNLAKELNQK